MTEKFPKRFMREVRKYLDPKFKVISDILGPINECQVRYGKLECGLIFYDEGIEINVEYNCCNIDYVDIKYCDPECNPENIALFIMSVAL
jgi:hypothetical protein